MKRTILLIIILLSTYSFKLSAQVIKKYKDGVSIDSLVVKWPRLNYNEVVAMLNEQGVDFEEVSFPSKDINDKKNMLVLLSFHKVYYKGIYIGRDGTLTFESSVGKDMFKKGVYRLKGFTAETEIYGVTNPSQPPTYKDILSSYIDLRDFLVKRYGQPDYVSSADSSLTDESDVEMTFKYLEETGEWLRRSWTSEHNPDKMYIELHIWAGHYLNFTIHWYPEFEPEKKKMKGKKQ